MLVAGAVGGGVEVEARSAGAVVGGLRPGVGGLVVEAAEVLREGDDEAEVVGGVEIGDVGDGAEAWIESLQLAVVDEQIAGEAIEVGAAELVVGV